MMNVIMKARFTMLVLAMAALSTLALDTFSSLSSLPQDDDGSLSEHLLVLPAGDECHAPTGLMAGHWHFTMQPSQKSERRLVLADGALAVLLGFATEDASTTACGQALCLERGTPVDFVAHWHHRFDPYSSHELFPSPDASNEDKFSAWFLPTCQAAELGFVSYHDNLISMYWVHPETKERVPQGELKRGERNTSWRSSYLGHVFYLEDAVTKDPIGVYKVLYNSFYVIGSYEPPPLSQREIDAKTGEVETTLRMEYGRSRAVTRTFSSTGFDKGSLANIDPFVWGSIQAYYRNNKKHGAVREEWDYKGLYVNWWEVLVEVIQMPWALKAMWHDRLQGVVQDWIGGEELEKTDIYGIRIYHEGARLLSHVDRSETHAASLIVNLDQQPGDTNTSKDWPVEILDLADHMHEVVMDPGDIVYYESARCLHARMQPLQSGTYANLFVHYRPKDDPQWYTKPNPPHIPLPVNADHHRAASESAASLGADSKSSTFDSRPSLDHTRASAAYHGAGGTPRGRVHLQPLSGAKELVDYWHFSKEAGPRGSSSSESARSEL